MCTDHSVYCSFFLFHRGCCCVQDSQINVPYCGDHFRIFDRKSRFPLEECGEGAEFISICIDGVYLSQVLAFQSCIAVLRVNACYGTVAPAHKKCGRKFAFPCSAGIDDLVRGVVFLPAVLIVADSQSVKFIQILCGISVEHVVSHCLTHGFHERHIFGCSESFFIRRKGYEFHVHFGAGFHQAAGVCYLFGAGFSYRHAAVNLPKVYFGQSVPLCGLVACRQVSFCPSYVF